MQSWSEQVGGWAGHALACCQEFMHFLTVANPGEGLSTCHMSSILFLVPLVLLVALPASSFFRKSFAFTFPGHMHVARLSS